jgi:hypothetical protein
MLQGEAKKRAKSGQPRGKGEKSSFEVGNFEERHDNFEKFEGQDAAEEGQDAAEEGQDAEDEEYAEDEGVRQR